MKVRCSRPDHPSYPDYGGRGIAVCDRWLGVGGFQNYVNDILALGAQPTPKHSLDRIDNDGKYAPDNIKWSSPREQLLNRRYLKPSNTNIKGVAFDAKRKRYLARFYYENKFLFIGAFFTQDEARLQYEYVARLFGVASNTLKGYDRKYRSQLERRMIDRTPKPAVRKARS